MKKALRIGLTVVLCVGIVVGYYYYLSHKDDNKSSEETTELTELDKIFAKDFDGNYPTTPREVVKWYNRIISAYYSEEYSDEELGKLADQARSLMDSELLSYNPRDTYLESLKLDIANYKERKKYIVQTNVCDSNDITYATVKGSSIAYVKSSYFVKEGSNFSRSNQEFALRKDQDGNWKILTFRLTEGEQND